jgi:hypothetical protein
VTTTKPQQIIPVILLFTVVISNIMVKLYVLKLRATSVEKKTWILFVNVIQKFLKQYQMTCILPCQGRTQTTALKIWTPGIPTLCMHGWKQEPFESIQMKILNKQPLVEINDKVKRMSGGK